jgi:hypothetical protein
MPRRLRYPLNIIPRILFDLIDLRRSQYHLMRLQSFGLLQEFPADEVIGKTATMR